MTESSAPSPVAAVGEEAAAFGSPTEKAPDAADSFEPRAVAARPPPPPATTAKNLPVRALKFPPSPIKTSVSAADAPTPRGGTETDATTTRATQGAATGAASRPSSSSNPTRGGGGGTSSSSRARLSVWDYCCAELGLRVGAREDDPDMAIARERVFDIIWYVPLEFERLSLYGGLLCADATLGVVTSLPVRVACQTCRLIMTPAVETAKLLSPLSTAALRSPRAWRGGGGGDKGGDKGGPGADASSSRQRSLGDNGDGGTTSKRRNWGFHPFAREHLGDSLWLMLLLAAVAANNAVDVSVVYHWIRGQDVIKLYMACSVLECFDKLCCAFNCHVLDALQNSTYVVVSVAASSASMTDLVHAVIQLSVDVVLALSATVSHTMIMLLHAVTLSVAINSHTNAMLLVLISNNFGEIKGHVFKRMDPDKLFSVARMDIVERVHLGVCLLFVVAQRITAAGSVAGGLTRKMLKDSAMVMGSEVFVDVFKHAFMSKFNGLRPRVYRGFSRQLCREHVKLAQSYKIHRVVGFVPLAPAAVLIKVLPDLYRTLMPSHELGGLFSGEDVDGDCVGERWYDWGGWQSLRVELGWVGWMGVEYVHLGEVAAFALVFAALVAFKLVFGVCLHWFGGFMLDNLPYDRPSGKDKDKEKTAKDGGAPPASPKSPPKHRLWAM